MKEQPRTPPPAPAASQGGAAHGSAEAATVLAPDSQPGGRSKSGDGALELLAPDDRGALGRLGPYRVLQVLGRGGMGIVYLAEDPALHRQVALKVMRPALAKRASSRDRFVREARATAQIEHDHIVTIYHVGEDRGVPYFAMQLLKGIALEDWLRQGNRLAVRQAVRVARETALGLAAAHARGLIHRDIKPANLWLETKGADPGASGDGTAPAGKPVTTVRIKILDFGLARPAEDSNITREGAILGTPSYMSPEQARSLEVDGRSDLFSLGCVLYRLTTGQVPFPGRDTMAVLVALVSDAHRPARELNPEIPPALSDLIDRMLAKEPDDRPASARAVTDELQVIEREMSGRVRSGAPTAPTTAPKPAPPPPPLPPVSPERAERQQRLERLERTEELQRPIDAGRGWALRGGLLGGLVLMLGAALVTCLSCSLVALWPSSGTVNVRADERGTAFVNEVGLRVIDEHGSAKELRLGRHSLPAGRYTVDPTGAWEGIRFNPPTFNVSARGEIDLEVRCIAVQANPVPAGNK
jgi:serine/threonine protein kinase